MQKMQLLQLQKLQQQLLQQTAMLQKVQGGGSTKGTVDSQLLASLEQLTKQLIDNKVSSPSISMSMFDVYLAEHFADGSSTVLLIFFNSICVMYIYCADNS